ncbi:MAG: DEAD/DEAH box helicase [Gammaproteobacteria bacterium]
MPTDLFHPAVADWFAAEFRAPTEVQRQAWPAIQQRRDTLLAAPTGSGKTLAAFLAAIDALVREGEVFGLPDETRVLYVSPLKALSNDIHRNLELPLAGIAENLGPLSPLQIRAAVRTGDTPATERSRMRRQPPHLLVTTPESLYILLTSESGRDMLSTVDTVIVDELHAVADNKRGAHLALSLERLSALCNEPPVRIGISATQKPIEKMAEFLTGHSSRRSVPDAPDAAGDRHLRSQSPTLPGGQAPAEAVPGVAIVDTGYVRDRDVGIEMPRSPLAPVMATEVWGEIYDRLAELVTAHRSTLIFVNTRRLAERVARHLAERIDEDSVTSHHGSLAKEHRLDAERRLKAGKLKALVATASLELGIDIGDVDLTIQLGSPRGIATFLQRVGRSGHGVDALPKGRLFPLTRDDLVESTALLDAVRREELDTIRLQGPALDVLAQQLVAEVASREWSVDELFAQFTRAWPYRELSRSKFDQVITMLADGYTTRRGRQATHIHLDAVNGVVRGRRGARLMALTNGGAIPDQFDYDVVMLPEELSVGTLNEDFAFESLPGDIFQLGNMSYRVLKVDPGKMYVEDAQGQPPNIPFWFGEAPGRTDELSQSVSRLREQISAQLDNGMDATRAWLVAEFGLAETAAAQVVDYLATAKASLGTLPTQREIVFERFFDEVGDTHLVIHSPYGSRLNRAWGLAIRKRFCRKFNFELQAAALEDSIVLSLGPTHSFPLEEVAGYLKASSVRHVLTQALLAAPMFPTHWRWAASIALAVRRNRNGKKVPPIFQRNDGEDLMAVVFPDQLACAENIAGEREIPDHPLVEQTLHDCLHELMDVEGLERLLERIAGGDVRITARDVPTPSPLAQEIITAKPFAFLDDAPAEERRTQAIRTRHMLDPDEAADLAQLSPAAIDTVCAEAWPDARNADELHDALVLSGFLTERDVAERADDPGAWRGLLDELIADRRATIVDAGGDERIWAGAERLGQLLRVLPDVRLTPPIDAVDGVRGASADTEDAALVELLRSRLETLGPVTVDALARPLQIPIDKVRNALQVIEIEGFVMRGKFRPDADAEEWCERRLLARINRYTIKSLRKQVAPVSPASYMRFLFDWHELGAEDAEGPDAVRRALDRLQGFAAPAAAWESALLPHRVRGYLPVYLDEILTAGEYLWLRPVADGGTGRKSGPVRNTPLMLIPRTDLDVWQPMLARDGEPELSSDAARVRAVLRDCRATFFSDLVRLTGLLRTQVEAALGELVANGLVTSDGFAGLRALITPSAKRASFSRPRRRGRPSVDVAGRWSLIDPDFTETGTGSIFSPSEMGPSDSAVEKMVPVPGYTAGYSDEAAEQIAFALLDRYGIVFRHVLQRESRRLPPWRQLWRIYRRLEARGEVRGGRFVSGFTGEQFAWPDAVDALRRVHRDGNEERRALVAAADPLNLAGIVTPGARVPATTRNRLLYRGGKPVALYVGGEFEWLGTRDPADEWTARNLLLRNDAAMTYIQGPSRVI